MLQPQLLPTAPSHTKTSIATLQTVDLFAGVGGLSLGFEQAGFNLVAAYDNWDKAIKVYRSNFKHPIHPFDLSNIEETVKHLSQYSLEIIIGGPPCQDFSSAGKRMESSNANLTESFALIATLISPQVIVMENVTRARTSRAYMQARNIMRESGYGITETVLDASLCGVPQKRKRFFCIAIRNSDDSILSDYFAEEPESDPLTVSQYMGEEINTFYYYRHPRNYSRRAIYSIHEPSATIRGVNRPIPPSYPGHRLDAAPVTKARPLTTYERSRIQTFPHDWVWHGCKTDVEQMIGNAVPVQLARFVAEGVKLATL